jgi:hypothetical protein
MSRSNRGRWSHDGRWGSVHHYGRRRWDVDAVAARAAPRGWPEFRSEFPGVLRLGFSWPKTVRGHRGFLHRVQCGGGWPQGGCRRWLGLLELRRHRTASPEVLRPSELVPKVPRALHEILPGPIASGGDEFGDHGVCFGF